MGGVIGGESAMSRVVPPFSVFAGGTIVMLDRTQHTRWRIGLVSSAVAGAFLIGGCATRPLGPSVMVMPAPNKPFEVFAQDQALCRSFADQQMNGAAASANNQAVGSAIVSTALGAGLGAAISGGGGAVIGAASGAILGTGIGASASSYANFDIQQRYNMAYVQCMYARGNQMPGYYQSSQAYFPPPPPNEPPPPPPR